MLTKSQCQLSVADSFDSRRTGVVLVLNRERRVSNTGPAQPPLVVCGILARLNLDTE